MLPQPVKISYNLKAVSISILINITNPVIQTHFTEVFNVALLLVPCPFFLDSSFSSIIFCCCIQLQDP